MEIEAEKENQDDDLDEESEDEEEQTLGTDEWRPLTCAPEARPVRRPKELSAEAKAKHALTHTPYQAWCQRCVEAKAHSSPRRRLREESVGTPLLELDYGFLKTGEGPSEPAVPVLLAAAKPSGYKFARVAKAKGKEDEQMIRALGAWLTEAGLMGPLRIRTDSEDAIQSVAQAVAALRVAVTVVETSPVMSSQSLGVAEHWSQMLAAQVRAFRLDVQQRWNVIVDARSPLLAWLVRHAEFVFNRFQPLAQGCTAFENVQQRPWKGQLCNITETMMGRKAGALKQPKLDARWVKGAWLGRSSKTGEHVLSTLDGIILCRSVRPLPSSDQDVQLVLRLGDVSTALDDTRTEPMETTVPEERVQKDLRSGPGFRRDDNERTRALREFQYYAGKTEGCTACEKGVGPTARKHIKRCKQRQLEFKRRRVTEPDSFTQPQPSVADDSMKTEDERICKRVSEEIQPERKRLRHKQAAIKREAKP